MSERNFLYVSNRKDWRNWLKKNHRTEKEIWLVYYKKHTGKASVPYNDAVEEALCFGWIDSIIRKIDDEKYAQKFTPRKKSSQWSESNKKRIAKLECLGIMSAAGILSVQVAKESGKWDTPITPPSTKVLHPDFETELKKNHKANTYFNELAPSYKRQYVGWISAAKKEETRQKRIKEAIDLLKKNQKLGLK